MQIDVGCSRLSWPLSIESTPVRALYSLLVQYELVRPARYSRALASHITALAAMCPSSFGCRRYCCFKVKYSACAKKGLGRVLPSQSRGWRGTHVTGRGSQQQQRQDARKTTRLPRNGARCKLETRPSHSLPRRETEEAPLRRAGGDEQKR